METTANLHTSRLTHAADSSPREEGYLHYVAREGRWALRWCIGLCIVGIAITMITPLWFVAFVPAGVMLLCGILLVLANYVEKRSDRAAHEVVERAETAPIQGIVEDHAEDDRVAPVTQKIVERESKTGLVILFIVVLAALLIAFIFLPTPVFAIGALVVFAYMLLLMAPVWLGWFNDDIEDETKRLEQAEE
jgi:4-hydroxybenzoate polyprenyltransferase